MGQGQKASHKEASAEAKACWAPQSAPGPATWACVTPHLCTIQPACWHPARAHKVQRRGPSYKRCVRELHAGHVIQASHVGISRALHAAL